MIKIGIVYRTFKESKEKFNNITSFFDLNNKDTKLSRNPDGYFLKTPFLYIAAIPLTDKICGMRFDFIFTNARSEITKEMEDIIVPMLAARNVSIIFE